jgi:hypothetical protein
MTKFLAAAVAATALAAVAGQAQAATSPEQRIAALEQQVATLTHALAARPLATPDPRVATLQKKEAALEKRVKTLEANVKKAQTALTQTQGLAAAGIVLSGCFAAATADAFTSTWNVVDQVATATQAGKIYFGPQAAVSDFQTCSALQITRQQGTVPPTVAVFSALTSLIGARR